LVGSGSALKFALQGIDHTHPYLSERNIPEEIARHFGVGFFPGKGSMSGRVVIPIQNEKGETLAYAGRAIDGSEPRYKLPSGFRKSHVLWNLHRVREHDSRRNLVIVVEGFFDCMKVHQVGVPHVVALMGSSMSERQQKLLSEFRHVIVMLDGDDAGREGAHGIVERLVHQTFVKVITLGEEKQPDQLSSSEIRQVLGV
jgi:DNA primase